MQTAARSGARSSSAATRSSCKPHWASLRVPAAARLPHDLPGCPSPAHCALAAPQRRERQGQQEQQCIRRVVSTRVGLDVGLLSSTAPVPWDLMCFVVAALGAKVWTKLFDVLVANGVLEKKLSRKLVHITTGPIFMLTWPLFSGNPWARVTAAMVPVLNAVRLASVGLGITKDDGLVASVSRSGDRTELLKGPLYYTLVLMATALFCWRDDPTGMVAMCLMCGGDGLADIVGRRFGADNKLPYNTSKSLAGSIAMLLGGTVMAVGLVAVFCSLGYFESYSALALLPYVLGVSAVATVVESLPINQVLDDNLSVPLVAALAAMLIMPHAAAASAATALAAGSVIASL